jgi:ABC-2 type transport system permease protein
MKNFLWLLRREFWENKAIVIVPAVITAALIAAALFGRVQFDGLMFPSPDQNRALGATVLFAFGVVFIVAMLLYCFWYLLDCLYSDRKDRSVLFWKSLPISDSATVLSKLFFGLIVIPVVYFAAADASSLLLAIILYVRARSLGVTLWQPDLWLQLQVLWGYLMLTAAIWFLPAAGWLLLVSAWAKRAVILWATLPLLGVFLAERLFIGSNVFAGVLLDRLRYPEHALGDIEHQAHWVSGPGGHGIIGTTSSVWSMIDPLGFLTSPATWIGVIVGGAMIAGAIQLRMRRADS